MKKLPDIIKHISLDSIGEMTNERYVGSFKVKVLLTHAERLAVERTYADMLPNDKVASDESKLKAGAIAELDQRVVEAPRWWVNSRNGRDLLDSQPIWDLLVGIEQKVVEWKKELEELAKGKNAEQ